MTFSEPEIPDIPPPIGWQNRTLRILLALIIIGAGIAGAAYLTNTGPKTQKRAPAAWVPIVQVEPLHPARYKVTVAAMGTVIPARQVVLESRVSGQVKAVHPEFTEGGFISEGQWLIQLDDADYKLVLDQRKSDLVSSQYALKLELGRQAVAQKEWSLLNKNPQAGISDSELALRKPHLEKARADVAAAEAAVQQAALDLERARILAPFNAIVRSKFVDVGSQVSAQESLAELVGTDTYWIQASVPVERLEWIRIPQRSKGSGSPARICYAQQCFIEGTVIRLMGDLTEEGRMARILIEVKDPLRRKLQGAESPPLLIGEYVRVEIEGRQLENVYVIPRTALRDDDTVWVATLEKTLDIRKVTPVWRDAETVVIEDGFAPGAQLVVSDLAAAVDGMPVRLEEDQASEEKGSRTTDKEPGATNG